MNPAAKILVCFALTEEAAPFQKAMRGRPNVSILVTGVGKRNAKNALQKTLTSQSPHLVLTAGFAGGLNPNLHLGDVLFATDDATLAGRLAAAGARPGKLFCADRIATTAAEKQKLRRATGAEAVEMESDTIQTICRARGIPCATVRVISDEAEEDLPLDFNQLSRPDQSLHYGKLALAIARSPGRIGALLRLQKQTRFAANRLAEVLAKVV